MSRQEVKRSLGILAVLAGVAAAVACGGSGYSSPGAPNPAPSGGGTADVTITINGMNGSQSFSPNPAVVKAGQTVAWRNADGISHDPTGAGFGTGLVPAGQTSAPITFSTAGNFDYHCAVHPSMVGTLTVQ